MVVVRSAAVAGTFYPASPQQLRGQVEQLLQGAEVVECRPKAIIVPHAGYIYSGPIAASAYAQIAGRRDEIERVVIVGPAHRVPFRGLAASSADYFATPLGNVPVDKEAVADVVALPHVHALDMAHVPEHSLEVQLPFLQQTLGEFRFLPLLVGEATVAEVSQAMEAVWGGDETLVVISSDLSHYHSYEAARALDEETCRAIEGLQVERLGPQQACGHRAISGLLQICRNRGMQARRLDLRNSGDTGGERDQVVGYAAFVLQ